MVLSKLVCANAEDEHEGVDKDKRFALSMNVSCVALWLECFSLRSNAPKTHFGKLARRVVTKRMRTVEGFSCGPTSSRGFLPLTTLRHLVSFERASAAKEGMEGNKCMLRPVHQKETPRSFRPVSATSAHLLLLKHLKYKKRIYQMPTQRIPDPAEPLASGASPSAPVQNSETSVP